MYSSVFFLLFWCGANGAFCIVSMKEFHGLVNSNEYDDQHSSKWYWITYLLWPNWIIHHRRQPFRHSFWILFLLQWAEFEVWSDKKLNWKHNADKSCWAPTVNHSSAELLVIHFSNSVFVRVSPRVVKRLSNGRRSNQTIYNAVVLLLSFYKNF